MVAKSIAVAAALLVVLPLGASARGVANDFGPGLTSTALVSAPSAKTTESLGFAISTLLSWDGGESGAVKLRVRLPAGLRWASAAPGPAEGCTRTEVEALCTKNVTPTAGTNLAATYGIWRVTATRAGSYTIEATILETSRPDPNPSNDFGSLTVNVGNTLSGVTLKPKLLKAGSEVIASHPVLTLDNEGRTFPISDGAVACSAKIGSGKVKAVGALSGGRATCRMKTPTSARGQLVSGTIRTTSAGLVLTKQFKAKLG